MPSNPEKYNQYLTDEVMRETAVKAARYATKLIDEANADRQIVNFDDHIGALGNLISGCAAAMLFPEGKDKPPDFDNDDD